MTVDESRVAGWYKSHMIYGPESKPIRTGATLHTLCVTNRPLSTYNLFARLYGSAKDDNLNRKHKNASNLQTWVNLYNLMLEPFKGKWRCMTMESAYMSNIMAQIGRYKWGINMVGTVQVNQTGADAKVTVVDMRNRKEPHKSNMWQHNQLRLEFVLQDLIGSM